MARRIFYALAIGIGVLVLGGILGCALRMPGHSFKGDPPPLTASEIILRDRMCDHVRVLATDIGERNRQNYESLDRARIYIEGQFKQIGLEAKTIPYKFQEKTFYNIEAMLKGSDPSRPDIVIGAHYDSDEDSRSPGANDNATGVAALLELARLLSQEKLSRTIRLVAFANEEPPYFNTRKGMGSIEYVQFLKDSKAAIYCMMSIETIGYYRDDKGSQTYPSPIMSLFYPNKGNFIAFVGGSQRLVRSVVRSFRLSATIPSKGGAFPKWFPGVDLSDHRSFWEAGIPALMVTDTADNRKDSQYHQPTDTAKRPHLQYDQMARVVSGLHRAVLDLDLSREKL